ncbi:MAG: zf-TFIIB domain-containing protein, partial [Polyangiaceae bacterium]
MSDALHCLSCGAKLPANALQCPACRSPAANVPYAPIASGVRCPRCKARNIGGGALARKAIAADCTYLECATCFGNFVEPHEWSAMLEEAIANDSRLKGVGVAPSGELPVSELFGLLQCPGCNRELDRLSFGGRSSISIDVCTIHGAWFDAGELSKVLDIVRYKNEHAGAMPTDDVSGLTAEQRREKVLESMGISDPEYDRGRAAPVRVRDAFSADRLAGRVAFVAGGFEGAAAYGVLKAVARGSEAAFEWAVKGASPDAAPIGDVSNVMPPRLGYQLPNLRCLFCGASHPESATQCGVCNTPIARVVCPACRSLIAAGEEKCRCGAPLMPDALREQMACPRCKSAL